MRNLKETIRVVLIILTGFLSLTSITGGVALLAGFYSPPNSQLEGTIFTSFLIPGLALSVLVGGSSLFSTFLLIRKNRFSSLFSTVTGIVIMFFEFVEVLMIGSPIGVARTLQIVYFGLGTIITVFSIGIWFIDIVSAKHSV
jgi:hypothetical protein